MAEDFRAALFAGALQLKQPLSEKQCDLLLEYLDLLVKWNTAYNLTAVRDVREMIDRHILDSLVLVPYLRGKKFIDVGTGAGLPGVVLAIVRPDMDFSLVDSNGKKTRFLFQVKTQLDLQNIEVIHARVEKLQSVSKYDGVLSRAFASLADMTSKTAPLLKTDGRFYAMKGVFPEQELSALPKDYTVEASYQLVVPGAVAQRHLVVIRRDSMVAAPSN